MFVQGRGAPGFRDFPGLPMTKENRNVNHRTPAPTSLNASPKLIERNTMPHPSQELKEAESTLKSVIQVLIDSQEGFQKIGDELKDETLKHYFFSESLQRAQFRGDLETILHQEGVHDLKESGTVAGSMERAWGDLKSMLGGGDHTLLATAEKEEVAAVKAYTDALENYLPFPVRQLLVTQSTHIQSSRDYIRGAKEMAK
jgi:uncharacterized protein (TIGR02284 family)